MSVIFGSKSAHKLYPLANTCISPLPGLYCGCAVGEAIEARLGLQTAPSPTRPWGLNCVGEAIEARLGLQTDKAPGRADHGAGLTCRTAWLERLLKPVWDCNQEYGELPEADREVGEAMEARLGLQLLERVASGDNSYCASLWRVASGL
jgi:hypothetical protein